MTVTSTRDRQIPGDCPSQQAGGGPLLRSPGGGARYCVKYPIDEPVGVTTKAVIRVLGRVDINRIPRCKAHHHCAPIRSLSESIRRTTDVDIDPSDLAQRPDQRIQILLLRSVRDVVQLSDRVPVDPHKTALLIWQRLAGEAFNGPSPNQLADLLNHDPGRPRPVWEYVPGYLPELFFVRHGRQINPQCSRSQSATQPRDMHRCRRCISSFH